MSSSRGLGHHMDSGCSCVLFSFLCMRASMSPSCSPSKVEQGAQHAAFAAELAHPLRSGAASIWPTGQCQAHQHSNHYAQWISQGGQPLAAAGVQSRSYKRRSIAWWRGVQANSVMSLPKSSLRHLHLQHQQPQLQSIQHSLHQRHSQARSLATSSLVGTKA